MDWLTAYVKDPSTHRGLIFFKNVTTLSSIFSYVSHRLESNHAKISMYHQSTPESEKRRILADMTNFMGNIKILLCTTSFSMGLNLANVAVCMTYGAPDSVESFVQQTGRVAREIDSQGFGIVLTFNRMGKVAAEIKPVLSGTVCIREAMLRQLDDTVIEQELCCDVCTPEIMNPISKFLYRAAAISSSHTSSLWSSSIEPTTYSSATRHSSYSSTYSSDQSSLSP